MGFPGFLAQFDAFHAQAAQATGLQDFGSDDYQEPLRRLLRDYDRYPRFSAFGIAATSAEIVGKLAGRLCAEQGFKTFAQFAEAPVERPLIVIGMPRTGTTALHRLLSADPGSQTLPLWLGAMPMPRPPRESWEAHPVYQQIAAQIEALYAASPALRDMHPVFADQADECRFAIEQSFWATGMATTATVPDYAQWCLDTDARFAYRRYRRMLGLIAGGDRRRWILKNPDHIFALDALLDVFPDACIVQTHREPAVSLSSVASMSYQVLHPREPERTPAEHGQALRIWIQALEKAERVRRRLDPRRCFDLHIDEFQADPTGSVERIYRHFDLPLDEQTRAAWQARNARDPRAGHGAHAYRAEDFAVSQEEIRTLAPLYCERYAALCASLRDRRAGGG